MSAATAVDCRQPRRSAANIASIVVISGNQGVCVHTSLPPSGRSPDGAVSQLLRNQAGRQFIEGVTRLPRGLQASTRDSARPVDQLTFPPSVGLPKPPISATLLEENHITYLPSAGQAPDSASSSYQPVVKVTSCPMAHEDC